jgi:predicted  nucleic acid-binding Zn-ribbon protein
MSGDNNHKDELRDALTALTQAQAQLTQTQAALLTQQTTQQGQWAAQQAAQQDRWGAFQDQLAALQERTDRRFAEIMRALHHHEELLEKLPEAVRDKIGFKKGGKS